MQLKIFFYGKTNNDTNSLSCVTPKMQTALKLNSIKAVSFLSVIPLGFEPKTPTLKVLCSTS